MEYRTPYYVIHKEQLDKNFKKLQDALKSSWSNYIIGYSYKTNSLPWIIKHFDTLGCFAEVVSEDEYRLAKVIGVKKNRIIYNGPIKTKETFLEAVGNGCIVNIDSQREIDWLEGLPDGDYNIGLRVNFNIEKYCPGQSQCAEEGGRFGFCYENGEFEKALKQIVSKGITLAGLHLHTSSKSRGLDVYKAIVTVACELADKYSIEFLYIDVGGGFFGGLPTKTQFDEYMGLMAEVLKEKFSPDRTALIVEPGMAVVGTPISYVTTVIDVKDTEFNRFVITDGTRTSIDPLMTKNSYFHSIERLSSTPVIDKQVICGYTCMEHDRLFTAVNEPEIKVGDRIIYDKVGAYTMCLTPLFIKYFPDVYVYDGEKRIKVRHAWKSEEYIQKSIIED